MENQMFDKSGDLGIENRESSKAARSCAVIAIPDSPFPFPA